MSINRFFFAMAIIVAAITIAGCKNSQQQDADNPLDFPEEVTAKWSYISNDEIIPRPSALIVGDSSIYVTGYMGSYWLHEFKKDSPSEAISSIKQGQGPAEVINAFGLTMSDDGNEKTIFDFNSKRFKTYDRDNNFIKQVDLKRLDIIIHDAFILNRNRCLIASVTPYSQDDNGSPVRNLLLVDLDSMNIIDRYDSIDKSLMRHSYNLTSSSVHALSPDGKHFASGTTYGGILEFFNITDNSIEQSFFKVIFPYEMETKVNTPMENPLLGFSTLHATNEFVYGAFWGTIGESNPSNIGVWKWDGKPVKLIHTDATVLALDIDEKTNTLYAVTFNQETGPQLAKMKL